LDVPALRRLDRLSLIEKARSLGLSWTRYECSMPTPLLVRKLVSEYNETHESSHWMDKLHRHVPLITARIRRPSAFARRVGLSSSRAFFRRTSDTVMKSHWRRAQGALQCWE
jgi:hypothetical protein